MKRPSSLPILAAFAMVAIALLASPVEGQLLRRPLFGAPAYQEQFYQQPTIVQQPVCNGVDCAPGPQIIEYGPTLQPSVVQPESQFVLDAAQTVHQNPVEVRAGTQMSVDQWYRLLVGPNGRQPSTQEVELARKWASRALRILNGNSCGTGNLCGRDDGGIYVMTNAHVATNRIGHTVRCQALVDGKVQEFVAKVVEAAYSSRTRTDWALLEGPPDRMAGISPIQLSKEKPDPQEITITWGCPRCEVPRGQVIETVRFGNVWLWQPNSIGGQSGSAVIQQGQQFGLLTWSEGGNGSGQFTNVIYQQSVEQNTDGPARTGFEVPVLNFPTADLREGYFVEDRETGLGEYPIWADGPTDPADPTDPAARSKFRVTQIAKDPTRFNALSAVVLQATDKPENGQFVITGSGFEFLQAMPEVGTPVDIVFGASSSTAPQENAWFLDFALYCWEHRDQLQDKANEIIALADWFKQFIGDFQQTSDIAPLEAELGRLIDATGYPMPAQRGDLLRQLILYAIQNPDQIRKWIDFIQGLLG